MLIRILLYFAPPAMATPLHTRFVNELAATSFGDTQVFLTYDEQDEVEENGTYAEVAREKLPLVERAMWWAQATAVGALILVLLSSGLTWLAHTGIAFTSTPFVNPFSIVLWPVLFSAALLFNLWRAMRLTSKRLLCRLVLEMDDATDETAG